MKLTQIQIQKIEHFLDAKQLTYVDIRIEVLDHMISDIENMMNTKNFSFEKSFNKSMLKWNSQLRISSSYIIGLVYHRPKIVIQKADKIFLKWYVLMLFAAISSFTINFKALDQIIVNYDSSIKIIAGSFLLASSLALLFWYFKLLKSGIKTSYLFIYEKQVFLCSIFCIPYILINLFSSDSFLIGPNIFFSCLMVLFTVLGYNLFKKHQIVAQKFYHAL